MFLAWKRLTGTIMPILLPRLSLNRGLLKSTCGMSGFVRFYKELASLKTCMYGRVVEKS